jgi:hypothetical protein
MRPRVALRPFPTVSQRNQPSDDFESELEGYVAAPISGELQTRLETYLLNHPGLGMEDAVVELLERALDQQRPSAMESPAAASASRILRLAERLCSKARARLPRRP